MLIITQIEINMVFFNSQTQMETYHIIFLIDPLFPSWAHCCN